MLRGIREREDLFHFQDEHELELDVTNLSPAEAAGIIHKHVAEVLRKVPVGKVADPEINGGETTVQSRWLALL